MNKLPPALQRQAEKADELQKALFPQVTEPETPVEPQEVVESEVQVNPLPVPPVVEQAPEAPAPQKRSEDYWEQRFRSVAGLLDKEVPRLRDDLQTALRAVETLRAENTELRKQKEEVPPTRPAVDPKDIEAFGADMVEMVQRQAEQMYVAVQNKISAQLSAMEQRLADIESNITGVRRTTTETLEKQFFATLKNLVPDWEKINQDQRWLAWLDEEDPIFGASRQAALDAAHQRLDPQRVAALFNAFKATLPKAPPAAPLSTQVAPNTAPSAVRPTAPPAKKIFTAKEVDSFYREQIQGKWRGRETEMARIEAEINAAAAEGRIQ